MRLRSLVAAALLAALWCGCAGSLQEVRCGSRAVPTAQICRDRPPGGNAPMRLRGGAAPLPAGSVCVIGSGNWGSAIARVIALNAETSAGFESRVRMWVYEEVIDGRNLTDVINTDHENPKYLPGIALPANVVAVADLASAVKDASILVWVLPHQFLGRLLPTVKAAMRHGAISVSLVKGMAADGNGGLSLISSAIAQGLGVSEVAVLMGANVADQVARGDFCEATLAASDPDAAKTLVKLFDRPSFRVRAISDVAGVEVCGALKNVVALGAGFADGLGLGSNTKAAIMRIGLLEMLRFARSFFPSAQEATMWESCGVADLITTCFDGRNRRCAERFASAWQPNQACSWQEVERDLLAGQKLQGPLTATHVQHMLVEQGVSEKFPLLETICAISAGKLAPAELIHRASLYY